MKGKDAEKETFIFITADIYMCQKPKVHRHIDILFTNISAQPLIDFKKIASKEKL